MGNRGSNYSKDDRPVKKASLRPRDLKFLCHQTGLPQNQIVMIFEKIFNENHTGDLALHEFITLYSELRTEPKEQIEEIAKYVFSAFDVDHNNLVSFDEFLMGYALTSRGDQRSKLAYAFDLYDLDNNGYIDLNELDSIIYAMFSMLGTDKDKRHSLALAQLCMKQLDKSGDGLLSKQEFINGLLENYSIRILMSPFN